MELVILLTGQAQRSLLIYNRELNQVRLEEIESASPPQHQIEILFQTPEVTAAETVDSDVSPPNLTTLGRVTTFFTCIFKLYIK